MKILFIGNFQNGPGGEPADETHIARELENQGHKVIRVPRDEWREYVIEEYPVGKYTVPKVNEFKFDIAIIAKWNHFYDESFIEAIKKQYNCPVFYWVWDWMDKEDWHIKLAKAADLYLSGELGSAYYYKEQGIPFYYFQFDSTDGNFPVMHITKKKYDVVFLGSHTNQNNRLDVLKEINRQIPIQIFAYDYKEWIKDGFKAEPAVYGLSFNRVIAESKIVLGTSANVDCFGYFSNRVGKVLYASGFLLQWYTPGMENILGDSCEYFEDANEAVMKIKHYLKHPEDKEKFIDKNIELGRVRWTSEYKVRQLTILMERFIKSNRGAKWILP